jgi:glutamine cyclotransferase
MTRFTTLALAALLMMVGCTAKTNKIEEQKAEVGTTPVKVTFAELYDYRIVAEYPHSSRSYTQGLQYVDGTMWEGTGQEGRSHLQRISLTSGKVDIVASLPDDEFGEGITLYKDRIYQLTWLSRKAHIYDLEGKHLRTVSYEGEGWGITTDGERLFMSDGSSAIRIIDPETFDTKGVINILFDGESLDFINEMEWIDGKIWANVYLTDFIVEIDPKSGNVLGFINLAPLRMLLKNNPEAEALNGIAYNPATKNLYVTGKDWNTLFEIEIYK